MMATARSGSFGGGAAATVVSRLAVLFELSGSATLPEIVAESVSIPAAVGVTTIVTVAWSPPASVPRSKVRIPPSGVTPPVAETNVTPAGSVSVSVATVDRRAVVGDLDRVGQVAPDGHRVGRAGQLDGQVCRGGRLDRRGGGTAVVAGDVTSQ